MTDKEIKFLNFLLKKNKELICECINEKITYKTWKGEIPLYSYNLLNGEIKEIFNKKKIASHLLLFKITPYIFFSKKKQAEVYKWVFESVWQVFLNRISDNHDIPPVVEEKRPWEYDYHCEIEGDFSNDIRQKKYPLDNFFPHELLYKATERVKNDIRRNN